MKFVRRFEGLKQVYFLTVKDHRDCGYLNSSACFKDEAPARSQILVEKDEIKCNLTRSHCYSV